MFPIYIHYLFQGLLTGIGLFTSLLLDFFLIEKAWPRGQQRMKENFWRRHRVRILFALMFFICIDSSNVIAFAFNIGNSSFCVWIQFLVVLPVQIVFASLNFYTVCPFILCNLFLIDTDGHDIHHILMHTIFYRHTYCATI
jgi:hypothetical protein